MRIKNGYLTSSPYWIRYRKGRVYVKNRFFWRSIGVVALVGGIICLLNKLKQDKKADDKSPVDLNDADQTDDIIYDNSKTSDEVKNLELTKMETSEKITVRHDEMKKVMKESVDNIFGDFESNETQNTDLKEEMFDNLDNL